RNSYSRTMLFKKVHSCKPASTRNASHNCLARGYIPLERKYRSFGCWCSRLHTPGRASSSTQLDRLPNSQATLAPTQLTCAVCALGLPGGYEHCSAPLPPCARYEASSGASIDLHGGTTQWSCVAPRIS